MITESNRCRTDRMRNCGIDGTTKLKDNKISAKIICENVFLVFLRSRFFKIIPKSFSGSQKIRENVFTGVQEISRNFFRENPYTHEPAKQDYLRLPKKPVKTQILRREFDSGLPRAFAARISQKPCMVNAKKRC